MALMRERFCILHYIYYHDDNTCVHASIYIWVTSRRRGNEPGGLDAHVLFFGIKLLIYIYIKRKRNSLFRRAKAPYVCMWCQPVTRYSLGWSVLFQHTHARGCTPSSLEKKAIVPFSSSSRAQYRHGLSPRSFIGPSRRPGRHEIRHGIYKDVKIFYEALARSD